MELTGAISEGEWSSLSGMYTAEEAAFMAQLLNSSSISSFAPNQLNLGGSTSYLGLSSAAYWSGHENTVANMAGVDEGSYYSSERASTSNLYRFSQESSDFSGGSCSQIPSENYYLNNSLPVSMNFCLGNLEDNGCHHFEDDDSMKPEMSESDVAPDIEAELIKPEPAIEDESNQLESSKKRSKSVGEVQKRRNAKSKKAQKLTSTNNNEEDGNGGHCRQSTSENCSEDESNASQELNGGLNSGSSLKRPAKTRASRGSATDPQSLYARRRRERINERLRILQNLVPNGTKVDISTMLEEAVQYVKFLQLQIKLLSSDDLWMYAPIAYNGMDIGLNLNLNTPKES